MVKFLEQQKLEQQKFKLSSPLVSDSARDDGVYARKPRPFCLPVSKADENLFDGIREQALCYFSDLGIKWHDGCRGGLPSNHLCDSQACCVNFLFPFVRNGKALVRLLQPIFPTIAGALPIEPTGELLTFEWIGTENYLRERVAPGARRTRGANFTSADAAVFLEHQDKERRLVLIEWKYTESYSPTSLKLSRSGTDRTEIYSHLYRREDFPLRKELLPSFESLFYEPFYQLLRLQCLAHEMEKARELGADRVSLLHLCPAANRDFPRVTSPTLGNIGATVPEIWKRLVRKGDRFASVATEDLFGAFPVGEFDELEEWWAYVTARYAWVSGSMSGPRS